MSERLPGNAPETKEARDTIEHTRELVGKILRKSPWILIPAAALYVFFQANIIPLFPHSETKVPPAAYLKYHYVPPDHSAEEIAPPAPALPEKLPPAESGSSEDDEKNTCDEEDDCELA